MLRIFVELLFLLNIAHADNILEDAGSDVISPFTTEARHYFHLGLAISGFTYVFFKDEVIFSVQQETNEHKPLGDYALYGDYGGQLLPNAAYAGGMYLTYLFTDEPHYKRFASQMFRASLYSGLFTTALKTVVHETRPNGSANNSFPSGHTTSAFAFATIVSMNHEWYWGIPAYMFAGFVGYSRINDNMHYLHDVTVGATIGIMYGLGIYYSDLAEENSSKTSSMVITPTLQPGGMGFLLLKTF